MANTLRIKRRASGSAGAPSSLENAELAFNEVDDTLYYGEGTGGAGGTATTVLAIAGSGAFVTKSTAQTISGNKTFTGSVTLPTLASLTTTGNVVVGGNLTVNGTQTVLNTSEMSVDDKNIVLADTASPSDSSADGGGITLKGSSDYTIKWVDATNSWTFNQHVDVAAGKKYRINDVPVLSATALGTGVTGSSLTSVGTLTSGTWSATDIAVAHGGTGASTAANARTNLGLAIGSNVQAYHVHLQQLSALTSAADRLPYFDGTNSMATTGLSSFMRNLLDDASASAARTTLGMQDMAVQDHNNVNIDGGTIDGITFDMGTF